MTFETFKIELTNAVKNLVGEEVEIHSDQVKKNNGVVLDAIALMEPGEYIAPTIYLDDLYQNYESGYTVEELAEYVVYLSEHARPKITIPTNFFMEYEQMRHRVCYRLVNYERNKEALEHMPHQRYLDLAVVYYYLIEPELMANASVLIHNEDMERLGTDPEQLAVDAAKNTPKLLPWEYMDLCEMVNHLTQNGIVEAEEKSEFVSAIPMYILTNKEKFLGAACLLYPDVLSQIGEKLQSSFYVLPSSIHECIIVPDSGNYSKEYLSRMVAEINALHLEAVEVLEDHAYYYDRVLGTLS